MGKFKIDASNLQWIGGNCDDADDLCLHGDAVCIIGDEQFAYHATVSATALYLLKSLMQDHIINEEIQMLPCCGFSMIPNEELTNVDICGCPNGIDWSVIHEGDSVRIITESQKETVIRIEEYKKIVFGFADKIENFYKNSKPKNIPKDEFEKNGYTAFWNEWHRRRKG